MNKYQKNFISFVIPCYNCEKFIERNILKLIKNIRKNKTKFEIILVNDGSNDKTKNILNKLSANFKNLKFIENKKNKGKSYSLARGISKTRANKVIIYDCDLPYFQYLNKLIKKLNKYKFVVINRREKKSRINLDHLSFYQLVRFLIGIFVSYLIGILLKLKTKDTQAGLKGFHKNQNLKRNDFISKIFFLDLELVILFEKAGITPFSIPVEYSIPSDSSIKLFNLKKNIQILREFISVIKKYKD